MHYLAFDVSRDHADGVLMTPRLRVVERFHLPNTLDAVRPVLMRLQRAHPRLLAGVESTNMYHLPVVSVCTELALPCRVLNPLLTREILKASIRKRKTDREDAVVIAKLLVQGEGRLMTRADLVCPGTILARSAIKMRGVWTSLLLHARHVERLQGTPSVSLMQSVEAIARTRRQLQREAIAQSPSEQRALLTSIPGLGDWLATVILGEIGDIRRFPSGDALIAYAGLDPQIRQSGAVLHTTGRLTKRGSAHLRWALCCGANTARQSDPELKAFYRKKRAEGKRHTAAMCATARKLAYRIHAVLRRGVPYVVRCGC